MPLIPKGFFGTGSTTQGRRSYSTSGVANRNLSRSCAKVELFARNSKGRFESTGAFEKRDSHTQTIAFLKGSWEDYSWTKNGDDAGPKLLSLGVL